MSRCCTVLLALIALALAGAPAVGSDDTVFVLDPLARNAAVFDANDGQILWNIPTTSRTHLLTSDRSGTSVFFDEHVDSYGSFFDAVVGFAVATAARQELAAHAASRYRQASRQFLASGDGHYLFSCGSDVEWLDLQAVNDAWHPTSILNPSRAALISSDPSSLLVSAASASGEPTLFVLNPFTDTVRAEIAVLSWVFEMVADASGTTAWTLQYDGDGGVRLAIVDLEHGVSGASVALGQALGLALNPQGTELYVVQGASVLVIDPHELSTVAMIDLTAPASSMAMSADGRRLFLTHPDANLVSTVDTTSRRVIAKVRALGNPSSVAALSVRPSVPYPPAPPDDDASECVLSTDRRLIATDAASGRVVRSILPDASDTSFAVTADGRWIDATRYGGSLWRYDAASGALVQAANVCRQVAGPVLFTESSVVVPCSPGPAVILGRDNLAALSTVALPDGVRVQEVLEDGVTALATRAHCEEHCTMTPIKGLTCNTYCTTDLLAVSLTSGDTLRSTRLPLREESVRVARAPDGSWFAVFAPGAYLGQLKIWTVRSADFTPLWNVALSNVSGVVASGDSKRLVVAGTPGAIFDALSGQSLASTDFTGYSMTRASEGTLLYAATGNGVAVVDSVSGQVLDVLEGGDNVIAAKIHACHDPNASTPRPTHTITPTLPPTSSPLPTRTSTATTLPTRTPSATPVPVLLTAVSVPAFAGSVAVAAVNLDGSEDVAGVQVDLAVEPPLRIDDCSVDAQIDKPASRFTKLPEGCSATQCRTVRAVIVSFDNSKPINAPGELFRCSIAIPAGITMGEHAIHLSGAIASDAGGQRVPAITQDGVLRIAGAACSGDCDHNGRVEVDDLLRAVSIAQGQASLATCLAADLDGDQEVTIEEVIRSVNQAMLGCSGSS
ncbi:MAG: hypothetical protein HY270_20275 [Deltaproteobacteria bacterium]|nr:hypothetical protein [Deltaproteobacteria bacterium]